MSRTALKQKSNAPRPWREVSAEGRLTDLHWPRARANCRAYGLTAFDRRSTAPTAHKIRTSPPFDDRRLPSMDVQHRACDPPSVAGGSARISLLSKPGSD